MKTVHINNREITVDEGATLLDAARKAGAEVPTLCYIKELFPSGACRMCVVEIEGRSGLVPSCSFPAEEGMNVFTNSPKVMNARRTIVELLLASHPFDCLTCNRNQNCELQRLASLYNIEQVPFVGKTRHYYSDFSSPSIVRNPDKCILCGRCVRVCEEIQGVAAIDFTQRGFDTIVVPAFNGDLSETKCTNCGQCVLVCPTGAIHEVSAVDTVMEVLQDSSKHVVVQTAPAIRFSLGEFYGLAPGENVTGKMVTALRRMGAKQVFDTDFTADLTIMEEANELIERITKGDKPLPMFTSCCPAWVKYIEQNNPEMIPHISSCKSPQQMMGSLIKRYFAEQEGIDPDNLFVISVMPCTAKKYEAKRPEMGSGGIHEVDAVLTTREAARLIDQFGIDFARLPEGEFDEIIGQTSGSGDVFAASGGVMESALRTAYNMLTGEHMENLDFIAVRGFEGIKEAEVTVGGKTIKVAVANTLSKAAELVEQVKENPDEYAFIEVMSCPGGCVGGGGQMYGWDSDRIKQRLQAVYDVEKTRAIRRSYQSQRIQDLYNTYLEYPGSKRCHELLHTGYYERSKGR